MNKNGWFAPTAHVLFSFFILKAFLRVWAFAQRRALMISHCPVIWSVACGRLMYPTCHFYLYTYLWICVCQTEREGVTSYEVLHGSFITQPIPVGGCVMLLCYKHDKSLTHCSLIVPRAWNTSACCELIVTQRECTNLLKWVETISTWLKHCH